MYSVKVHIIAYICTEIAHICPSLRIVSMYSYHHIHISHTVSVIYIHIHLYIFYIISPFLKCTGENLFVFLFCLNYCMSYCSILDRLCNCFCLQMIRFIHCFLWYQLNTKDHARNLESILVQAYLRPARYVHSSWCAQCKPLHNKHDLTTMSRSYECLVFDIKCSVSLAYHVIWNKK